VLKPIEIRPHARRQMKERQVSEDLVKEVLSRPDQVVDSYGGRKVAQSVVERLGKRFLIRIIYEEKEWELKAITVYLTTKVEKYWR